MLSQLPHNQITLKSDDEESIKALKRAVAAELRVKYGKSVLEVVAPDSASNGLAEGAARDIKGVTRTLLHAVATMHGAETIPARHALAPWAVRHAGVSMTLAQVGPDGRTAYERMWGKKSSRLVIPFAERVMYHIPGPSRAEPRWEHGLFLGLAHKGLYYIGVDGKVVTSRSVMRLPPSEKRSLEMLNKLLGTPWSPTPGEIHLPEAMEIEGETAAPEDMSGQGRKELREFGYTKNCPGCDAARLGLPARGHTEACRVRIETEMRETESGRARLTTTIDKCKLRESDVPSEVVEDDKRLEEHGGRASGSGTMRPEPVAIDFKEKRRQQEADEMRIVTRRIDDDRTMASKRHADELERERAQA
eukprot:6490241-Amphidinium_carterae.3